MDFGSALSNLAVNAGQSQIAGVAFADAQATSQMHQMQALAMKKHVEDQAAIQEESKQLTADFRRSAQTADDTLKWARQMSAISLAHGDFEAASNYEAAEKSALDEKKRLLDTAAEETKMRGEGAAKAAFNYMDNPTPEAAQQLALAAQRAGVDPKTIPPADAPAFATWAQGMTKQGMDTAKRIELKQKDDEFRLRQTEIAAEKARADETRRMQIRETAAARAAAERDRADRNAEIARHNQEMEAISKMRLEDKEARDKAKGGKVGLNEQKVSDTIIRNSAQAVRVIDNMLSTPQSAAASLFSQIKGGNLTDSLVKAGGNLLTKEADQEVTAIGAEMGVIIGQIVTAGSGGRAALPIVQSFQQMTTPQVGDTPHMKLLRLANAAEIVKLELKNITPGATEELESSRKDMQKFLGDLPSTKDILKLLPQKDRQQTMSKYMDMVKQSGQLQAQAAALPKDTGGSSSDSSTATSGGWSIKPKGQ